MSGVVFLELGAVVFGLALLARVADRLEISPIPLYLAAGLVFGAGGVAQLDLSEDFVEISAEIGVVLLLLTLGLEYRADELEHALRAGTRAGLVDVVLNATPGVVAAVVLGFGAKETLLLAGITYISSSGIVSKVLRDLDWLGNRETPSVLSLLVLEDLAMALYLPLLGAVLLGGSVGRAVLAVAIAVAVLLAVLIGALRYAHVLNRLLAARSNEALLLGVVGLTLLVAGATQELRISAAVGAFLVGIALSGPVQARATALIDPLRDLFAALFFLFFGLQIDPGRVVSWLLPALALAVATAATKFLTGTWAARRAGVGRRGQVRAGTALIARGEFSIVIAGIGAAAGVDSDLGSLAAGYVLLLAAAGPILARFAD
ncbi:MAG TPA: cation:proton antiporter [Acidimicrobiia bacterium]